MKSILTLLVAAALLCPLSGAARAAERDARLKPPPADAGTGKGGTRPPREKPGNTGGDKGGTRPPREKPGTGGDGYRPEEQEQPIIPPPPPRYHWRPAPVICEYCEVEEYDPRPFPSSSGNPLMDAYLLAISTTVVTNAATMFTDGNVRAFGVAGIAMGAVSLIAAPFREDPSEQSAFALAGIASIVLGALNLDERSSHATSVPYRSSSTFISLSF